MQEGLRNYLERKRVLFNRFFFLSNEELIAVYADQSSTNTVARLMPKMFDGVEFFELSEDGKAQVTAICSRDLERITFAQQVVTKAALPERWLRALEFQMTSTLKSCLISAYEELLGQGDYCQWVRKWQGQVSSTVSFLWFTESLVTLVTKRHVNEAMSQKRKLLAAFQEQVLNRLQELAQLVRVSDLTALTRKNLATLLTQTVNFRDNVGVLLREESVAAMDFQWLIMLKMQWVEKPAELASAIQSEDKQSESWNPSESGGEEEQRPRKV